MKKTENEHKLTCPRAEAKLKLTMLNKTNGCRLANGRNSNISPVRTRPGKKLPLYVSA